MKPTPLAQWMKDRKLKDADVASMIDGLSRSQISRIRRRKSTPSPETALKLAKLTEIPAERFVFVDRAA